MESAARSWPRLWERSLWNGKLSLCWENSQNLTDSIHWEEEIPELACRLKLMYNERTRCCIRCGTDSRRNSCFKTVIVPSGCRDCKAVKLVKEEDVTTCEYSDHNIHSLFVDSHKKPVDFVVTVFWKTIQMVLRFWPKSLKKKKFSIHLNVFNKNKKNVEMFLFMLSSNLALVPFLQRSHQ